MRDGLERHQAAIYLGCVGGGALLALLLPGTAGWEPAVTPALALMLFATFLQVPLAEIFAALRHLRFLAALVVANFAAIPLLALALVQFAPDDPLVRLGILLVLLTPCIDYVVAFAHLGRADARLLLAATPLLLVLQMALLPAYLALAPGVEAALVSPAPFLRAFLCLIVLPLMAAGAVRLWAARTPAGAKAMAGLALLPVPATGLVLLLIVAATLPVLGTAAGAALAALPLYLAFAVAAPLVGWATGRLFALPAPARRALAFSAATRNSLVILPLALAVPGAMPVLPAVIVTQTLVELLAELAYIRLIPRLR